VAVSISLTVLGCATPYPRSGAPCSGYLIRSEQAAVWVDCGSGTFAALQEHVDPADLDAIWLSHLHPDHCADLLTAFNWAVNTSNLRPVTVYGPSDWATRLASMLPLDDAERVVRQTFDVHELHDGQTTEIRDLHLTSRAVEHSVPGFGLRAKTLGVSLAYSGDTGPCPALIDLARDVDLLVCEAGATEPTPGHCTPQDAAQAAAQAHARRLVLTHMPYAVDPTVAVAQAARVATCPVSAATASMTTTLTGAQA
jgi:ribonuclease BN (tRNA processing enzyme)